MGKLVRLEAALVGIEPSYRTAPTFDPAADAVKCRNPNVGYEGARMIERPNVRGTLGQDPQVYAGTLGTVTLEAEVKGSGVAGTPPEIGKLLRGCAFSEIIVPATSVTYAPISNNQESVSIDFFEDGDVYRLRGCRGQVQFTFEGGGLLMANFTMVGHITGPFTEALPAVSFVGTTPPPFIGASVLVGGYVPTIDGVDLDMGNVLAMPGDVNDAEGYGEIIVSGRDPNGAFRPEAPLVADKDFHTAWKESTPEAFTTGPIGTSAGNIVQLDLPKITYRSVERGDRDEKRTYDLGFGVSETTGDDEVALIFT